MPPSRPRSDRNVPCKHPQFADIVFLATSAIARGKRRATNAADAAGSGYGAHQLLNDISRSHLQGRARQVEPADHLLILNPSLLSSPLLPLAQLSQIPLGDAG